MRVAISRVYFFTYICIQTNPKQITYSLCTVFLFLYYWIRFDCFEWWFVDGINIIVWNCICKRWYYIVYDCNLLNWWYWFLLGIVIFSGEELCFFLTHFYMRFFLKYYHKYIIIHNKIHTLKLYINLKYIQFCFFHEKISTETS